jgi:hypothetical protein
MQLGNYTDGECCTKYFFKSVNFCVFDIMEIIGVCDCMFPSEDLWLLISLCVAPSTASVPRNSNINFNKQYIFSTSYWEIY